MESSIDRVTLAPRMPLTMMLGAIGGLVLRLAIIGSGLCDGHVIADDAYYYFTIAHNIVAGAGATFDRLATTNGFHPLYQLLLVPVFSLARAIGSDAMMPVHGALALCALFDAATALLLGTILVRMGNRSGGTIAAWLWSLSPASVLLTLRGLEGAVSAFTVCLVLFLLTTRDGPWLRPASAIRLGGAIGLAFLARTDNAPLIMLAIFAFTVFDVTARRPTAPTARQVLITVAGTLAGAALIGGPWLLWNLVSFGNMVQVSGLAKAHNRFIFGALPQLSGPDAMAGWLSRLGAPILFLSQYIAGEDQRIPHVTFTVLGVVILVFAFALLLLRRCWLEPRSRIDRAVLAFVAVFLAAHLVLYGFVLGTYVVWYATVPLLLATLAIGGIAGGRVAALSARTARWEWCVVLFAVGAACYVNFFQHVSHGPRSQQREVEQSLQAIRVKFPNVRTLGGFNVGAAGYFSTAHGELRVVNLDGIVNNRLYEAWRHGQVLAYLERNVDLIVMDAPATMRGWLSEGEWEQLIALYPRVAQSMIYGPRAAGPGVVPTKNP